MVNANTYRTSNFSFMCYLIRAHFDAEMPLPNILGGPDCTSNSIWQHIYTTFTKKYPRTIYYRCRTLFRIEFYVWMMESIRFGASLRPERNWAKKNIRKFIVNSVGWNRSRFSYFDFTSHSTHFLSVGLFDRNIEAKMER